jgi:hypothetical protein
MPATAVTPARCRERDPLEEIIFHMEATFTLLAPLATSEMLTDYLDRTQCLIDLFKTARKEKDK